jgi:vancomycin resistance protein YoaR
MVHPTEPEKAQEPRTSDEMPTPAPSDVETSPETPETPETAAPTEAGTGVAAAAPVEGGSEPVEPEDADRTDEVPPAVAPTDPAPASTDPAPAPTDVDVPSVATVDVPSVATPAEPEPVVPSEPVSAQAVGADGADASVTDPSGVPSSVEVSSAASASDSVVPSAASASDAVAPSAASASDADVPSAAPVSDSVVPSVAPASDADVPSVAPASDAVAPSAATATDAVAPSAATPAEPAPVVPPTSSTSTASEMPSFVDEDDVPYQPRVFAFDQQVPDTASASASAPAPAPTPAPQPSAPAPAPLGDAGTPADALDAQATQVLPATDVAPGAAPAAPEGFAATAPAWTSGATTVGTAPSAPTSAPPVRTSLSAAFTPVGAPERAPEGPTDPGSPLDALPGDKAPSRLPKVALWAGIGAVVLGGLYTGVQAMYADKVPPKTTVAGVEVGGLTTQEAEKALEKGLGGQAKEPVTLQAGTSTTTLDPAAAGLAFDAQATADELTSFSMSPVRLWKHVFGGGDEEPVTTTDDAKLTALVTELKASLALEPVDGSVVFTDGQPVATAAQDGAQIVEDESLEIIRSSWLTGADPLELPTTAQAPEITQDETDAALAQGQQVVSAPVTVAVGGQEAELTPDVLASAASFPAVDGALQLAFDGPTLLEAVVDGTDDLLDKASDAKFVFVNGAPSIQGGAPGTTIDPAALSTAVATAATGTNRTASVELVQTDPADSVAALEALGVKEKVSEFSTPLTNDALRTENLRVGASKVNGTLIKPGETFSLVETLSPITAAGGYHSSGIVQDGKHVEGIGGGLSQMATTTYNAGFFAGFDDVEHRPHSYWFTRYPAGREATIFVGSIDMKFKNDTPYGALMQSWVAGGQLHVAIWSTKHYEVQTSSSGQQSVVQPTTVTHTGADCVPQPMGNPGFSVTTYRKVLLNGQVVKDEKDTWRYKPDNAVVCAP